MHAWAVLNLLRPVIAHHARFVASKLNLPKPERIFLFDFDVSEGPTTFGTLLGEPEVVVVADIFGADDLVGGLSIDIVLLERRKKKRNEEEKKDDQKKKGSVKEKGREKEGRFIIMLRL